jgi:LacI family transcriptional regulator
MTIKRPTQADVAKTAGVSRATVSYVLNDQIDQRIPISVETRQRVMSAITKLGYVPDARAQSLRSGSTRIIGVLLPLYENPHFWRILRGISSEAEAAGYSLLLSHSSLTAEQELNSLRELSQQRVDGMIILLELNLRSQTISEQLRRSRLPIVKLGTTTAVANRYTQGTRALMEHLFSLGHQRIGFVHGVIDECQGQDRLLPYREMLASVGVTVDHTLLRECGPYLEDGYQAAKDLLCQPQPPTALLAINDLLGMACIRAAVDLGMRVPQDLSVASFDDIPFASYTVPRLTTVTSDAEGDGRQAVQLLLKRLEEPDYTIDYIQDDWRLEVRESTGVAPRL